MMRSERLISRTAFINSLAVFSVIAALLFLLPMPASAQSLNDLRASGKVGEAFDGFARARDGSVQSVVSDVNAKRSAIYVQRAREQGISPAQVGEVYASQIITKSPAGTWILMKSGTWKQK